MAQITGIAHVELSVRDLEASERWYSELLGMRRVFHEAGPADLPFWRFRLHTSEHLC